MRKFLTPIRATERRLWAATVCVFALILGYQVALAAYTNDGSSGTLISSRDVNGAFHSPFTDTSGNLICVGAGTAGTPSGGVVSVQGVANGTAIPVSISGTTSSVKLIDSSGSPAVNVQATNVVAGNGAEVLAGEYQSTLPTITSGNVAFVGIGPGGQVLVEDALDMAVALGAPTNTAWVSQTSTVITSSLAANTYYRFSCNSAVNYRISNGASAAVSTDNFLAANTVEKFATGTATQTNLTVFPSTASGNCTITSLQALP